MLSLDATLVDVLALNIVVTLLFVIYTQIKSLPCGAASQGCPAYRGCALD